MRLVPVLLLLPTVLSAQQLASASVASSAARVRASAPSTNSAVAARALRAPAIDGRDDDAVWATAQTIDSFRTFDPVEDGDPRYRTEAKVAYDERNLYVFVRAYDPHPDSIVALLSRRDERTPSEWIKVMIDSYHDRRTGYEFAVNPAGVKRDFYMFNDGEEDGSWDAVWEVATRVDSLGWVAEYRIPLSQLRYPKSGAHTFGFAVWRDIARHQERVSWPLYRRSKSGLVSQLGEVSGFDGIGSPRRLEVAPYTVAKTANVPFGADYRMQSKATMGADIKYGITSNLTLDATVNPDFGQVEADPSVLNLSARETFVQEKRPFFLEGQGLFRFDVNCNDGVCSGLFYSRRIGRAPQLGGGDGPYYDASNAQAATILGAGKLTGNLGRGLSIGVLNATTRREVAPGDRTIEPQTNYVVARVQQDLRDGASGIGVMATAVNRGLDEWSDGYLRRNAYAGGVNFRHKFAARRYELTGYYAQSLVTGTADAIAATQLGLVHNYGRPDDRLAYDPTRTSLGGNSAQLLVNKIGGEHTRFTTGYQWISPGFEINDVGYLSRANSQNQFLWWQYRQQTPKWFARWWNFNVNQWANWAATGERTEVGGNINTHWQLKNMMWLHFGQGGNALLRSDCDNCMRGGPAVRQSPSIWGWAGVEGDNRKAVNPNVFWQWGRGDEGRSFNWSLDPGVNMRVASRFSAYVGLSLSRNVNDVQPRGNYGVVGEDTTHYTVAHLDQKTMAMTTRLNFTATPNLSVQVYAQPFVTSGAYTNWRQLDDAGAPLLSQRFASYAPGDGSVGDWNFNFKQHRSNTVVRWEYRPGSVLYFVWAQERTEAADNPGTFDPRRDAGSLFRAHPGNVFLVKGSYWLNW